MKHKKIISLSLTSLMSFSLVGCGATLEEYKKYAEAGQAYSIAMDSLFTTSAQYFVDQNSVTLLANDLQEPASDQESYENASKLDAEWLNLVGLMRQHTNLLKKYFEQLENLATSNTPEQAKQATEKVFNQINSISNSIQQSPLIRPEAISPLSSIPKIILSSKIKGALREELLSRKEAIYRELELQDIVIELLATQLKKDLQIISQYKEERTTYNQFISETPVSNPDAWIIARRNFRITDLSVKALEDATKATTDFKNSFQLVLEDRFSTARANALLAEISYLLTVTKELKTAFDKPSQGE